MTYREKFSRIQSQFIKRLVGLKLRPAVGENKSGDSLFSIESLRGSTGTCNCGNIEGANGHTSLLPIDLDIKYCFRARV